MMIFRSFPILALSFSLILLPACKDKEESAKPPAKERKEDSKGKPKEQAPEPVDEKAQETSKKIEAFTGDHTRVVWTEVAKPGDADAFAVSEKSILRGIDTRDGKGERTLMAELANYSRPLLSHDGTVILYTEKNITRPDGLKHYRPEIYRTDWISGKATKLTDGYAADMWKDPATGIEWVYAVRNIKAAKAIALEASELVRFPLNDPSKVELVYNDTPVGPDNIQLSRDGTRASGLFPWPHCGIFRIDNGKWTAVKKSIGCWPSLAPDNSGVSWIFEGEHRHAFFFAEDGRPDWVVSFNNAKSVNNHEVYHPRWSNHARFLVISGPYIKTTNEEGSVINKGGVSAQIVIGKFNDDATQVEGWLEITHDDRGEAYPDMWVANGDQSNLKGYSIKAPEPATATQDAATTWPVTDKGVLFTWQDRGALNSFTTADGKKHEARVEAHDAARFGLRNELLLDGGWYEFENASAQPALTHLKSGKDVTFEAIVFPATTANEKDASVLKAPGLHITFADGHLNLNGQRSSSPLPDKPFQLSVTRKEGKFSAYINGEVAALSGDATANQASEPDKIVLGGGWNGGTRNIGLYDHAFTDEQIHQTNAFAVEYLQKLPAPPQRIKLQAKLIEASAMPTAEGIDPYTSSLVIYLYEVEKVLEGEYTEKEVLVKHWGMLGLKPVLQMPREAGKSYELILEKSDDHAHLKGERVMDDTTAFDLVPWVDVSSPRVAP